MATIGLRIAEDPNTSGSLSLADTLAKGIFGDPEGQMKARALASEVGVRMASRDKLLADTGLVSAKTKTEQDAEAARLRAGPLVGEAGAAAVPMPVPVEASRTDAPGTTGYGPQPGIVSPHDQAVYDSLVARERALGPVLVLGDNPNATAEGINKNYGGTILSAAASNPAIVSGDSLRIAGGLSTGTAPSTATVWSVGDTSGVDAAAREHILEKRAESALPEKPHDVTYRGQPGQTYRDANGNLVYTGATGTEQTPEKPDLVDLPGGGKGTLIRDANGNPTGVQTLPGAESRPEKQEIVDLPSGGKGAVIRDTQGNVLGTIPIPGAGAAPKLTTVGKDTAWQNPDGTLTAPTVQGRPAEPPPSVFAGNSTADEALNFTTGLGVKMQDTNYKPTYQEAATYASAYNHLYEQPKPQEFKRADGSTGINWVTSPPPANSITPAQVFARLTGQAAPPVQAPASGQPPAPVVVAPAPSPAATTTPVPAASAPPAVSAAPPGGPVGSVVTQELTGPGPPPAPTDTQSKDRRFAGSAAFANKPLDAIKPDQIPGVVASMLAIPKVSGTGFLASLARSNLSEQDKEWARNALEFTAAVNYEQSGAAVNADEWENAKQIYIPMPGDKPKQLADKRAARRNWMENAAKSGWSNDPKGLQNFMASLDGGGGGPAPSNDNAPAKAPPAMKDAWSHMSKDAKDRARQRYGQ